MIEIKSGIRHQLRNLPEKHRAVVISDDRVGPLYAEALAKKLHCPLLTFPSGERSKTRGTKEWIEDQLIEAGYGRDSVIIAVGGGVVTDLVGFLAATYCRGVPLILIPTSLLAMVDASIGGKTGVNVAKSKNFVGAMYSPQKILIDPETLITQPLESYRSGFSEMIKHGLIWDVFIFRWIEQHLDALLEKKLHILEVGIRESCQVKQKIVEQDEHEKGMRRLLNFGHTVGHAIETATHYEISHGHAVAIGCLVEGYLSQLSTADLVRIARLFHRAGFSLDCQVSAKKLMEAMMWDKKGQGNIPRFVTLEAIGTARAHGGDFCVSMPKKNLNQAFHWMSHDLCQLIRS